MDDLNYSNPILDVLLAEESEPDWLIPEMMLQGTLVLLAGEAGAGKSLLSYTIALALASGRPALSSIVPEGEPKTILYFDDENSEGDRNKYLTRAWHGLVDNHGQKPDEGLLYEHFYPVHFRLGESNWFDVAARFVEHFQPQAMFFDTAAACFDIEDENDNSQATKAVKQIRALMRIPEVTATAIVLKHANVVSDKGRRTIRGAKAWKSMADQTIFQVKVPGRPRKDGLSLTRMEPDKARAYGLSRTVHITPSFTDPKKIGCMLEGSYRASREHRQKLQEEGYGDDE